MKFSIKKLNYKRLIIPILVLIALIGSSFWLFKPAPKEIYEVAVFAHSQQNNDPVEDLRTSMKAGDVLAVMKDGHSWSNTELVSYLILKMSLTEEQAQKLTMADEKGMKIKDLPKEEQEMIDSEKRRAKAEGRDYEPEPLLETIRPRLYRIRLEEKVFEGFAREQLLEGQPYMDRVFDWEIVEKKEKIK